jgi:CHAT domain-containing protein/Tfp pilus assembly protein PilF
MRATFGRLVVLLLLVAGVRVTGQPVPAPVDKADEPARPQLLAKARLLTTEGVRLHRAGDFHRARAPLEQALALYRQAYPRASYPNGHRELGNSLNDLALLYQAVGDHARAEPVFRETLAMYRALFPPERFPGGHPALATIINNVGELHRTAAEYEQAEPLLREALAMRRALFAKERYPAGHADLAQSLNNVGALHVHLGAYARAEPFLREALDMRRALYPAERFPDGHVDLSHSISNLAFLHQAAGEHAKALALNREALVMRRALYPLERYPHGHPHVAASLSNLGTVHRDAGEFARAEALYREALAMRRALYPKERFPAGHDDLAASLNNLGALHKDVGEYAQAEPLYREALAMRRALYPRNRFPNGHPSLAININNLANLYQSAGEFAKAEPLYREALAMHRALYPPERFPRGHPALALSINNFGFHQLAAGDFAEGARLYREALAMRRAVYPKERFPHGHPELAQSINNVAAVHVHLGEHAKAAPLHAEALAMRRALYPKERFPHGHPEVADSLNNLGFVHRAVGDYARAEALYREGLTMRRALYPPERFPAGHPTLAGSLHNLGLLDHCAGKHARAEPLLREALAMYGRLLRQHADLAAEAESRNFAGTQPLSRDALLSGSRHQESAAAVYDVLWDGRAILTRLQERRHRELLASADPAAAALGRQLQHTRRSLARLLLGAGQSADAHRQTVAQLTQTKEELEKRIAAKLRLGNLPPATQTTVQQLREALPSGAVFVDLLRYASIDQDPTRPGQEGEKYTASYVAFVVGKGQPVARVELGAGAAIEAAWAAWHKALLDPGGDPTRERAAARAFAKLVWKPIRAALPADCRTVYLTPDGALAQVPWAALPLTPLPRGERGRGEEDSLLSEEHAVCLVPHGPWLLERLTAHRSLTVAARGGTSRDREGADTLLVYGGIDYEGAPAVVAPRRGPRDLDVVGDPGVPVGRDKRLQWTALQGTAREQAQIVALAKEALKAPPIIRTGRAASTDQLLEDLPRARYAHLATHGFFADAQFRSYLQVDPKLYEHSTLGERRTAGARSPLVLSGLVLAGANRQGEDAAPDRGIVTAEGLIGLRLEGLELAVLSACETGLGEVAGGEGVFGLQRAFHIAGCRNVIASLWQVDDEATAALMGLFYHHLWVEKRPPLEALRQAQLTLCRHPERISQLARARGPDFDKAARLPAASGAASARRAPARLWAGFVLSGVGR